MLGAARPALVPTAGEYLTDGDRLVQVLSFDPQGAMICEDVAFPADEPAPIVRIIPEKLKNWQLVIPETA